MEYKDYTNAELEEEITKLKESYEEAQQLSISNYEKMIMLARRYGEAQAILVERNGGFLQKI